MAHGSLAVVLPLINEVFYKLNGNVFYLTIDIYVILVLMIFLG